MSFVDWPAECLSWVYKGAIDLRNGLFNQGIMSSTSFSVPVVSVGNITAGGTGKTPMIHALIEWAIAKGLKPGIVSRGYGGDYSHVEEVILDVPNAPVRFGDEPTLTKLRFPDVPFFVCRSRAKAVEEMLKENSVDIVFADDAFQHRALERDLDIVMLDAGQSPDHYKLLPLGRLREPLSQLSRAQFVVITRWNLADEEQKEFLNNLVEAHSAGNLKALIHCDYNIKNLEQLSHDTKVILFSGIGNPKAFEMLISQKALVLKHRIFRDHHQYQIGEIQGLLSELESEGGFALVTTEKDAVKLKALGISDSRILVAELELSFDSNMEQLFGAVGELIS